MLRKIFILTGMAATLLLLSGCHLKEKISNSITEGIVEKAIGENADVDLKNGEISLKGENGEEININEENGLTVEGEDGSVMASGGEYEWPEGQAADYLPECSKGKITYILNSEASCMIYINETELEDFEAYVKDLKDMGYTSNTFESSAEDMQAYSGATEDGLVATVYYVNSEKILEITMDASAKQ